MIKRVICIMALCLFLLSGTAFAASGNWVYLFEKWGMLKYYIDANTVQRIDSETLVYYLKEVDNDNKKCIYKVQVE